MLYKVTPLMTPPQKKEAAPQEATAPKTPRKRRKSAVFDAEGHEVLITMMCLKCKSMKPLAMFGLRKMADGAIRNQPWCRPCRSGASSTRKREKAAAEEIEVATDVALSAPAQALAETMDRADDLQPDTSAAGELSASAPA